MSNIHVATIRVFQSKEYVYLSPFIVTSDVRTSIPHRFNGTYQTFNGWSRYKQLRQELDITSHKRHFEIIDQIAALKSDYTSRQLLSHPEASSLLLELVELNRQTDKETLMEFLIKGELQRVSRSTKSV